MNSNNAQSTLEYTILIAVIVAGLLTMQIYMKRGYQGKLKAEADTIGQQYSLQSVISGYRTITTAGTLESCSEDGTITQLIGQQLIRTGGEYVDNVATENLWE